MKILCVIGTRPEAIKMAPIIIGLNKIPSFVVRVLATAQHREMLDQVLDVFGITPDIDFNIMLPNQSLSTLTARLLLELDKVIISESPDVILTQGDTTTVLTVCLAAFYHKVPIGHVEAGLRTGNILNPFPEEMNRVVASRLAKWHFAPTESSRKNLISEGVESANIYVTGNTVIDALMWARDRGSSLPVKIDANKKLILVTTHRRENFGGPLIEICNAVLELSRSNADLQFLFPVHPNPNVKMIVHDMLGNNPKVILCEPLEYLPFVTAMKMANIILSDSGGVQEEAPALGKPVLVLRNETERPEAVEAGLVKLIGTDCGRIVSEVQGLIDNQDLYFSMARGISPYGDGKATERIVGVLQKYQAEISSGRTTPIPES